MQVRVDVLYEDFITQDEIDARLTGGSNVHQGQFRIYEYFMEGHDRKENIAKKYYLSLDGLDSRNGRRTGIVFRNWVWYNFPQYKPINRKFDERI